MRGNFTSIMELAQEVDRIESTKNDYLVNSKQFAMVDDSHIAIDTIGSFEVNDYAHGQIASKLNIPKRYYDDMAVIPGLRQQNVNAWLDHNDKQGYFVRTLDNKARAFLSNSYRPIDNFDVMSGFLPAIKGMDVEVKSCALSEKKLYLQLVFPKNTMEIVKGDVVQQGFILTNSEVGAGAVDVKHMIWRLVCSNGMIGMSTLKKYHIGSRLTDESMDIFKDDTVKAEIESFRLRLRDVLTDMLTQKTFIDQCAKMKLAVDDKIANINDTVSNVTKRFGISERYNDAIISNMAEEGNINRYGLANGITALAKGMESVDSQYEIEKIGSLVINMTKNEWGKYVAA